MLRVEKNAPPPPHLCTNPLQVKHPRWQHQTPIYYLASHSKITPALQASVGAHGWVEGNACHGNAGVSIKFEVGSWFEKSTVTDCMNKGPSGPLT